MGTQWRISRSGITSPQQSMAEKKYTLDEYPGKFDKAVPLDLKGFRITDDEEFKKIIEKIPESFKTKFSYESKLLRVEKNNLAKEEKCKHREETNTANFKSLVCSQVLGKTQADAGTGLVKWLRLEQPNTPDNLLEVSEASEDYQFADPVPDVMKCVSLSSLVTVDIPWKMLTVLRPNSPLEEEFFSK